MTASRIFLAVSLAANIALWGMLRWTESLRVIAPETALAFRLQENSGGDGTGGATAGAGMHAPAGGLGTSDGAERAPGGSDWAELRSDDLPAFVARLRAAGFPPHVVRAIIASAVNERFAARRGELLSAEADAPYWKQSPGVYSDPEKMSALSQLNREREQLLRQLLGGDASAEDELMRAYERRRFGDLPPEKLQRLQHLLSDYNDLRTQLRSANRPLMPEEAKTLAALEKEFRADLAKLLTPRELEQYDLRSSPTASQLRHRLDAFRPSEDEYKAIFGLYRPLDEQSPISNTGLNPQQMAARRAAEEQIQSQLLAALGPERYADYQQATNPSHAVLNQLAARLGLPLAAAREVAAVQQSIGQRAKEVLTSETLTPEQQTAQLQALHREATAQVSAALTPRGLEAYQQHGGQWLQTLIRPVGGPGQ